LGFRDNLRQILTIKDSPHRLATAFAMGVFIGVSPLLGLHTVLGIAFAFLFRLNKIVTITGVFVTNPWTIVPIYTFSTYVGAKCLGMKQIIPKIDWSNITLSYMINAFKPLLMPFVIGTLLVGLVSAVLGYLIIYHSVKKVHSSGK
jgi:uncharacterized protein (DUF2062 family)